MNAADLATLLECFTSTLKLNSGPVEGMSFKLGAGVLLVVPSAGARRQQKWRASKGVSEPVSKSSPRASPKRLPERLEPVSQGVSQASPVPLPSSPLTLPSDSYPSDIPKASTVVAKEPDTSRARLAETTTAASPRNFEEALNEPLCSRVLLVRGNPTLGSLLGVSRWPEVVEVSRTWHAAGKRAGEPRVTQGVVDALVAVWSEGFVQRDVLRVAKHLPTTERFRDKVLPSCLSVEVVTIALGELDQAGASRDDVRERLRRASALAPPSPLGALLPAIGGTE